MNFFSSISCLYREATINNLKFRLPATINVMRSPSILMKIVRYLKQHAIPRRNASLVSEDYIPVVPKVATIKTTHKEPCIKFSKLFGHPHIVIDTLKKISQKNRKFQWSINNSKKIPLTLTFGENFKFSKIVYYESDCYSSNMYCFQKFLFRNHKSKYLLHSYLNTTDLRLIDYIKTNYYNTTVIVPFILILSYETEPITLTLMFWLT
ncbi:hypothetical protein AGLY_003161 [Aphis glycines]|uniref:Uncharacterized protein n=1 Tax=Aphis glycines TaxID=307491 RepID=A0A6G0U393_APHGL|nr:hypothetical protein AGLY_003161 [Aphis glycines]